MFEMIRVCRCRESVAGVINQILKPHLQNVQIIALIKLKMGISFPPPSILATLCELIMMIRWK